MKHQYNSEHHSSIASVTRNKDTFRYVKISMKCYHVARLCLNTEIFVTKLLIYLILFYTK